MTEEINVEKIKVALQAPLLRLEFGEYLTLSDGVWHPGVRITIKDGDPHAKWMKPFKQSVMGPDTRADLLRALADMLDPQEETG